MQATASLVSQSCSHTQFLCYHEYSVQAHLACGKQTRQATCILLCCYGLLWTGSYLQFDVPTEHMSNQQVGAACHGAGGFLFEASLPPLLLHPWGVTSAWCIVLCAMCTCTVHPIPLWWDIPWEQINCGACCIMFFGYWINCVWIFDQFFLDIGL